MNNTRTALSKYGFFVNLVLVGGLLIFAVWLVGQLWQDGLYPLAAALSGIAVFLILVYVRPFFSPWRWIAVGIALSMLFTMYPLFYTLYLSMTNMGSGHLVTKQQAIERLESEFYLPEGGLSYSWTAYQSESGDYALWLVDSNGVGYLAFPGQPIQALNAGEQGVGEFDEDGIPLTLEGYERLPRNRTVPLISTLGQISFGEDSKAVRISSLQAAKELQSKYRYDSAQDAIINQETGAVYYAGDGAFVSDAEEELSPGYIVYVGLKHFENFLGNPGFREPLLSMLLWNIGFAFFSVFASFGVGLVVTLLFDNLPGRRIIRALLIIPWPIPVLVSILIWRSMLNPDLGFVAPLLESIFGTSPAWFQDTNWTRFAVIMVNVWLSYPYFYVISAGAIRSIPTEIYDAAVVDGASAWNKFYHVTLPLLLRILMPLLIASFTFNFNNFNVIYIFNFGNPPMANSIVPMGHTDILISFVYRLAFVTSNVPNYGLAAAITVMLFILVASIVIIQMRFTNMLREVD